VPRIEDLYEVPPVEIEMIGGYFDGRRMHVPDNRDTWLMPVPVSIGLLDPWGDVTRASMEIQQYRWTGSIRDDGTRVFRAV
jgi:aminopeptidase N